MSAFNETLLMAGEAIGELLHKNFSDLTQAERVFVLNMCLLQELNPPKEEGMTFEQFEKTFNEAVSDGENAKR
jgi:hypothetical protein